MSRLGLVSVFLVAWLGPNAQADVQDNGLNPVGGQGLAELRKKVTGRDDLVDRAEGGALHRYDTADNGTYFFTLAGAPAHPYALYCGRNDAGTLEIRGWHAGKTDAAEQLQRTLKERVTRSESCRIEVHVAMDAVMTEPSELYRDRAFAFPGGATRAVVLSFDDGLVQDRRLIDVFDRHELKGTFHLVSGFFGTTDDWLIEFTGEPAVYVDAAEIEALYSLHEVSSHSISHPALTSVDDDEVLRQVNEDRATLARLSWQFVDSHAYPFGDHDDRVVSLLAGTTLLAARTAGESGSFDIPDDFLRWEPTTHHLNALPHIDRFLALDDGTPAVLLIAGHSWEFDIGKDGNDWDLIERISERLGGRDDVWSAGFGELARYLAAVQALEQGPSGWMNPGDVPVWIREGDAIRRLDPGPR